MKTTKILTKNSRHTAVIINDTYTVVKKENEMFVYDNVARGEVCDDQSGIEEFVLFFENRQKNKEAEKEAERLEKIEQAKLAREEEDARIEKLVEITRNCQNVNEIAEIFDCEVVDAANHWSELHNGRSTFAILFGDKKNYMDFDRVKDRVPKISGYFAALSRRNGEHHSAPAQVYDLENFQDNIEKFLNDKFFYRDAETEEDVYLEKIKDAESIADIKDLLKEYDDMEEGWYTWNDSFVCGPVDNDFLSFYEDVTTVSFGFVFEENINGNGFFVEEDDEVEDED